MFFEAFKMRNVRHLMVFVSKANRNAACLEREALNNDHCGGMLLPSLTFGSNIFGLGQAHEFCICGRLCFYS